MRSAVCCGSTRDGTWLWGWWGRYVLPSYLWYKMLQSVQLLSCVWLFVTPWITAHQAFLSITISQSSLKLTSIKSVMPSSHLILCRPLLLLPPISPSIKVFSSESTLRMRWPKNWSFSFSIIPSKEHPELISFRMDWLDLLAVQGTLKSLFQFRHRDYTSASGLKKKKKAWSSNDLFGWKIEWNGKRWGWGGKW